MELHSVLSGYVKALLAFKLPPRLRFAFQQGSNLDEEVAQERLRVIEQYLSEMLANPKVSTIGQANVANYLKSPYACTETHTHIHYKYAYEERRTTSDSDPLHDICMLFLLCFFFLLL